VNHCGKTGQQDTPAERTPRRMGRLVVISGPSGVGKSSIIERVLRRTGAVFSVSVTTRRPRAGEVAGKDYIFVERRTFQQMRQEGQLLEWAEVFGEFYGTPAGPIEQALRAGNIILLDIDVQGGLQVAKRCPDAMLILIEPSDEQTIARRLGKRGSESPKSLQDRLEQAGRELKTARDSGVYNYTVVNDRLDEAVGQVIDIINRECKKDD